MKWFLSAFLIISSSVLVYAVWPNDDATNTTFVKNDELKLGMSFTTQSTQTPSVVVHTSIVANSTPTVVTNPVVNEESVKPLVMSKAPEISAIQSPAEAVYSFEEMWSVLLRHLQSGVSQQELAEMRALATQAGLPVQWMFAGGAGDGDEDSDMYSDSYWFEFMTIEGKSENLEYLDFLNDQKQFVKQLKACKACPFGQYGDILREVFASYAVLNASENTLAQSSLRPFYALARLSQIYEGRHLAGLNSQTEKDLKLRLLKDDAEFLINSGNEVMRMTGRNFKAILANDVKTIMALADESDDIPYGYLLKAVNPIPHQALVAYVKHRIDNQLVGKDREGILWGAIYHAQFYSVNEAAEVLELLIEQFPQMEKRAVSRTIFKAQQEGIVRLSDTWSFERYEGLIYEGRKGREMTHEDMIKYAFNIFARVENKSAEQLMKRFSRSFTSEDEALNAFNNVSWVQMAPFTSGIPQSIAWNWNITIQQLDEAEFSHPFHAGSYIEFELLNAWNLGGDKTVEIKHIFPQLTPYIQNEFIKRLELDGSDNAKALLMELH